MEISLPFLISADKNADMMADTQAAILGVSHLGSQSAILGVSQPSWESAILGGSHLGRQPSWAMRRKLLQSSAEQ